MYIQFLEPSPKAGQNEHVSREVGAALITAGFAKELPTPEFNVTQKEPRFEIVVSKNPHFPGAVLRATCPKCGRQDTYPGRPGKKNIEQNFLPYLCVHFRDVKVPEELIEQHSKTHTHDGWGNFKTIGQAAQSTER